MPTSTYRVQTEIDLDDWGFEALKWAYERLGVAAAGHSPDTVLSAIAHDLLHASVSEIKDGFLDGLAFKLTGATHAPLTVHELYQADRLEEQWREASPAARTELLKRLGALEHRDGISWTVLVKSPTVWEVRP